MADYSEIDIEITGDVMVFVDQTDYSKDVMTPKEERLYKLFGMSTRAHDPILPKQRKHMICAMAIWERKSPLADLDFEHYLLQMKGEWKDIVCDLRHIHSLYRSGNSVRLYQKLQRAEKKIPRT